MECRFSNALLIGPHTDDVELGAGGLAARLQRQGTNLTVVAYSIAEESVPPQFPRDVLITESRAAADILGVSRLEVRRFPVRHFPAHRQEILEDLIKLRTELRPDLVVMPCRTDVHQDHQVIASEATRAFKGTTLLGYELPWNNLVFAAQALIALSAEDLDAKTRALAAYRSQAHREYVRPEVIMGWARMRGVAIGTQFAEAFEVIRWVLR